jgi:hypothetical protein
VQARKLYEYAILTAMKEHAQEGVRPMDDEFWTEHRELWTAHFPTYYRDPQTVFGRLHTTEEDYFGAASEIVPLT